MKVPFFNYQKFFTQNARELTEVFNEVGGRGAFILQKDLVEFEEALTKTAGVRYSVGCGNATDGLEMLLEVAGIGPGDEVIVSTHTMLATASAVHRCGAIPVPVDIDPVDGLISVEAARAAVTPRTAALLPTQLNGRCCRMSELTNLAANKGLIILEDAAQALGATFEGKPAGGFGVGGAISFYPAKNLGSLGDAGAVVTNVEGIYEKVYQLHDHGRDRDGVVRGWGRNSRLDNLQAAILNYKIRKYGEYIDRRREIARMYQEALDGIPDLILPPGPDLASSNFDVYQNYEVRHKRRDELRAHLADKGVGTIIQWGGSHLHQFEIFGFVGDFNEAEKYSSTSLLLPMNDMLDDQEVEYIIQVILEFR